MNLLFIGDSITEGQGSGSYVETIARYLPEHQVKKLGISGTTIGEYSPYPVEGDSLLYRLKSQQYIKAVKEADMIYLEYGANDASALLIKSAEMNEVLVSIVKAIDAIKQLNPKAKISFLVLSRSERIVKPLAKAMTDYLIEYYGPFSSAIVPKMAVSKWLAYYMSFVRAVEMVLPVIDMLESTLFYKRFMSEDKLHPNDKGYEIVASSILNNIELDKKN